MFEIGMVLGGYLIGSIPFGLIISKIIRGVDPRRQGSGNIGATNVLRVVGKKEAVLTLICDLMKAFLPVSAARALEAREEFVLLVALAVIVGHVFPLFLKFKGGKGVATSFGAFLALAPAVALLCLLLWVGGVYFGKYSSTGALTAFAGLPFVALLLRRDLKFVLLAAAVSVLVYVRHLENIQRILKGTEGHSPRQ